MRTPSASMSCQRKPGISSGYSGLVLIAIRTHKPGLAAEIGLLERPAAVGVSQRLAAPVEPEHQRPPRRGVDVETRRIGARFDSLSIEVDGHVDRKSFVEGKRVAVRVALGGRR